MLGLEERGERKMGKVEERGRGGRKRRGGEGMREKREAGRERGREGRGGKRMRKREEWCKQARN